MDKRKGKKAIGTRIPVHVRDEPQECSLEEAVDFVVKVKRAKNLKKRTIEGYVTNMRYFIDWTSERYGEIQIHDVTADMLREYVLWCSEEKEYYEGHPFKADYEKGKRGLAASSVNVRIRVLRTFFNVLHQEGIIGHDPAKNVSLMRQDEDTVEPLTNEELQRLLKAPDKSQWAQWRDYIIMVLIIDSGMRLNEICALEKTEINFAKKYIVLPASKNKNRKSRVLPLSSETIRLLKQLIAESSAIFDSPYVFTTNYGEQLSEKTIQKAFTKHAEKAKIGRSVSPHVLRHNFATMSAESGMSIFHLQKILGHAEIATTRKYVQLSEESIQEQHGKHSPLSRIMRRK